MIRIFRLLFPRYDSWKIVDTHHFNASWYCVQARRNIDTGYVQFRHKKIVKWAYDHGVDLSVSNIENDLSS